MIPIVLLLTTVWWANPTYDQGADGCGSYSPWPNTDLDHVEVWGAPRWQPMRLQVIVDARGRQGLYDHADVDMGTDGSGWLIAVDSHGNRSCADPIDPPGKPVSVDVDSYAQVPTVWYDVAGRRIDRPTRSGVYWAKTGDKVKQISVVR